MSISTSLSLSADYDGWIRSRGRAAAFQVLSAFLLLFASTCFLGAALSETPHRERIELLLAGPTLLVGAVFTLRRVARRGALPTSQGLKIRGAFSQRTISWDQIEGFVLDPVAVGFSSVGRVHLKEDDFVRMPGIRAPRLATKNGRTMSLIDALNEDLAIRQREIRAHGIGDPSIPAELVPALGGGEARVGLQFVVDRDGWARSRGQAIPIRATGFVVIALGFFSVVAPFSIPDAVFWGGVLMVVGGLLTIAVGAWMTFRLSRAGALSTASELVIRGCFSQWSIPWDQIERISLGRAGYFPFVGRVHLKDGSISRIWGIQAPNIAPSNRRTSALIDALNQELARHQTT